MNTEEDLRSALRVLERETPDAETLLRHVAERTSAGMAGRVRRSGRRLMAGAAAAAAVIAIAAAAALVTGWPVGHGRAAAQDALRSVPRYYMTLVPAGPGSYVAQYAVVRDTVTGRTLASVRPPRPDITFILVTGAADDRTFVLTAQRTLSGSLTSQNNFYYARFNPADNAISLTPLALRGLPFSNYLSGAALSPDGTRLAVASWYPTQIAVYSLPSGKVRVWTAQASSPLAFGSDVVDVLSWSRGGTLAFNWDGSQELAIQHGRPTQDKNRGSPAGEYLLNTNATGGALLAHSRMPLCLPTQNLAGVVIFYFGYITPDGTKIIAPLARPIKPGQRPPACHETPPTTGQGQVSTKLEEFSAATGRAIRVVYRSPSPTSIATFDVFWSNASGSVLVLDAPAKPGFHSPGVLGVLSGGKFTPIPTAPSPFTSLIAF